MMQDIEIVMTNRREDKEIRREVVKAEVIGYLAVRFDDRVEMFTITHIPTGRAMPGMWASEKLAKHVAKDLNDLDIDWSKSDKEAFIGKIDLVMPVLRDWGYER